MSGLDGEWTIHIQAIRQEAGAEQQTCVAVGQESVAGDSPRACYKIIQVLR